MIFRRQSISGNLSTTLIISGVLLIVGATFLLVVLPNIVKPPTSMWLGDGIFRTKLALNNNDRTKGLSRLNKLDSDQALLMAYPSEGKWGIWMKDMNFPIDVVWLDKNKKVIFLVKNALPEDSTTVSYKPDTLAKYVVELPAGTVDDKSITTKNSAVFQINSEEIK